MSALHDFWTALAIFLGINGRRCKRLHKEHHRMTQIEYGGHYCIHCQLCGHIWYERR